MLTPSRNGRSLLRPSICSSSTSMVSSYRKLIDEVSLKVRYDMRLDLRLTTAARLLLGQALVLLLQTCRRSCTRRGASTLAGLRKSQTLGPVHWQVAGVESSDTSENLHPSRVLSAILERTDRGAGWVPHPFRHLVGVAIGPLFLLASALSPTHCRSVKAESLLVVDSDRAQVLKSSVRGVGGATTSCRCYRSVCTSWNRKTANYQM